MRYIRRLVCLVAVPLTVLSGGNSAHGLEFPEWGVQVNLPADQVSINRDGSLTVSDASPGDLDKGHFIFRALANPDFAGKVAADLLEEKRSIFDTRQGRRVLEIKRTEFLRLPAAYYEAFKTLFPREYYINVATIAGNCLFTLTTRMYTANPFLAAEHYREVASRIEPMAGSGLAPNCESAGTAPGGRQLADFGADPYGMVRFKEFRGDSAMPWPQVLYRGQVLEVKNIFAHAVDYYQSTFNGNDYQDMDLEATVFIRDGSPVTGNGIFFRGDLNNGGSFSLFNITRDGRVGFYTYRNGAYSYFMSPETKIRHAAVRPDAPNRLRAELRGETVKLFVNDQPIKRVRYEWPLSGSVGVYVSGGNTVEFSDFQVIPR